MKSEFCFHYEMGGERETSQGAVGFRVSSIEVFG
jgi:hypothetical protein